MELLRARPRALLASVVVCLLTITLACGGDPSGPPGNGGNEVPIPVTIGDTVQSNLGSGDTLKVFTLTPSADIEVAVFMQGLTGGVRLTVSDSSTGIAFGGESGFTTPTQTDLMRRRTEVLALTAGTTYHITATPQFGQPRGTFQFFIYQVNRAPEHVAAAIAIDDTISAEPLENSADIDEFSITIPAGQELIGYFRPTWNTPVGVGGFEMGLLDPAQGNNRLAWAVYDSAIADMEGNTTDRFTVAAARTYVINLRSYTNTIPPGFDAAGGYQFQFRQIVRAPEHVSATITPGDTLTGEAIDYVGDIDDFTVTAAPGQEFNLFLHAGGAPASLIQTEVTGVPFDAFPPSVISNGSDTALTRKATGTFAVDPPGTFQVQARGLRTDRSLDRGPYRLFLYPINRQPEIAGTALTLGDTLTGETIELPGDVDEFSLSVQAVDAASFVLRKNSPEADPIRAVMPYNLGTVDFTATVPTGSGRFLPAPNAYTVTLRGNTSIGTGFRGAYTFETHALSDGTESVPSSVATGDTVNASLTPNGDYDRFTFSGTENDLITMQLQGLAAPSNYGFEVSLLDSLGSGAIAGVGSLTSSPSLSAQQTGRFALPYTGSYVLQARPTNNGAVVEEQGDYRFAVLPISLATEHVGASITAGDTVTLEQFDSVDDVDEFLLSGPPLTEVQIALDVKAPGFSARVDVMDPDFNGIRQTVTGAGNRVWTGKVFFTTLGAVRVRILGPNGALSYPGAYDLETILVDSLPEGGVPTAVVPGDTVVQSIEFPGDVDVYRFFGTAGQQFTGYFQTPNSLTVGPALVLYLRGLDDIPLGTTVFSSNPTPNLTDQTTGPFVLPVTGIYSILVSGQSDRDSAGNYRFQFLLN